MAIAGSPPAKSARTPKRASPDAWLKPGVLLGALVPLIALGVRAARGMLGANPIAEVLNQLGLLALIFLVASLMPTPLKALLGITWPLRIRRMLGLLAFFYAALHFLTYLLLDRLGDLSTLLEDVVKRPFITVGLLALLLMLPLAVTSTDRMVKRLGFARWKRLHRLAYLSALLAVMHFVWRVKKDLTEPLIYGLLVLALLALRLPTLAKPARPPRSK